VREAIASGNISELRGYQNIYSERRYGKENSRIDLLLEAGSSYNTPPCYVEIKNVTLVQEAVAYFPDAVSNRAAKHLRELMGVIDNGGRAVIFFCVQRNDCKEVRPAVHIDKVYAETLKKARQAGVEALAYRFNVSAEEILLDEKLPVIL
jgi:sugar fermentation stimulation protein A